MIWQPSHRGDPFACDIADRHYNRQKVGSPQCAPPGSCCVLKALTPTGRAFWITSAPFAEYVKHDWAGAWVCSAFRNEGAGQASEMIRDAVAASLWHYSGVAPALGVVTFLDREQVRPTMVRGKPVWGWTWLKAGFRHVGWTRRKRNPLMTFQMLPHEMPPPSPPIGLTADLFGEAA